jgi:hypothetical protein
VLSQPIFNNGGTDKYMDQDRFLKWFSDQVYIGSLNGAG